jgi:hypothetical protein
LGVVKKVMSYFDELADAEMISPIQSWDPVAQNFPLPFNNPGQIRVADDGIHHGIWSVHRMSLDRRTLWGFKIHVAPKFDEFEDVLAVVDRVCRSRGIEYKHVRKREVLWALYSKNAPLVHAGKGIAIYPARDELEIVLRELYERLEGRRGPIVHGDYRLGESILHVRYGAFRFDDAIRITETGDPVIFDPDGLSRVDVRTVAPIANDYKHLPPIFDLVAPADRSCLPERYAVLKALASHAGGGVYLALDKRMNREVILKRGVSFLGIDSVGMDGFSRIKHEYDVLSHLDTAKFNNQVPSPLDTFRVKNDLFLVEEYLGGRTLAEWTAVNNPIYHRNVQLLKNVERLPSSFRRRVFGITTKLRLLIDKLGSAGVIHNDLQPVNILVTPQDEVALVDFEGASCDAISSKTGMRGIPWVYGRAREFNSNADQAAVHRIGLYCQWPAVGDAHLDESVDGRFHSWLSKERPTDDQLLELLQSHVSIAADWHQSGRGLSDPNRSSKDRRWITSLGFGKGLLGALFVRSSDEKVCQAQKKILTLYSDIPERVFQPSELGYIDGGGMIPIVLNWHQADSAVMWASTYVDSVRNTDLHQFSWRLDRGIAGVLLTLHLLPQVPGLVDQKERVLSHLRTCSSKWLNEDSLHQLEGRGFFGGAAGVAFALSMSEENYDAELAGKLLDVELSTYQKVSGAMYYTDSSNRYRPYFDRGNAGTLISALNVFPVSRLRQKIWRQVIRGLFTGMGVEPGFAQGTAGILGAVKILQMVDSTGDLISDSILSGLESDLASYFIRTQDGLVVPGKLSRRISLDGRHGLGGVVPVACANRVGDVFNPFSINQVDTFRQR